MPAPPLPPLYVGLLPPSTLFETPIPGLEVDEGFANSGGEEEEDVEGLAAVGDEDEEVGVMDVGSGEDVCARPACARSVGLSQLPAPPRPVWRYSGAG